MTTRNPALAVLDLFVGEWSMVARFDHLPSVDGDARVSFEWLPGKQFLVERWEIPIPEALDGIGIIGQTNHRPLGDLPGRRDVGA